MTKEMVFVYGTLKKGFRNHHYLQKYQGVLAVAPGIELHDGPGFPYAKEGDGTAIGEIYYIDYDTMRRLDNLEGVPTHYNRVRTQVFASGKKVDSWIYISPANAEKYPRINDGEWKRK